MNINFVSTQPNHIMDTRPSWCDCSLWFFNLTYLARYDYIHAYKTFSLAQQLANSLHRFTLLGIGCLKHFPSHVSIAELCLHFKWWLSERGGAELEVVYSWPELVQVLLLSISSIVAAAHRPSWSPLAWILALRCRVKEQLNLGDVCIDHMKSLCMCY